VHSLTRGAAASTLEPTPAAPTSSLLSPSPLRRREGGPSTRQPPAPPQHGRRPVLQPPALIAPRPMAAKWAQKTVIIPAQRRGCHLITPKVLHPSPSASRPRGSWSLVLTTEIPLVPSGAADSAGDRGRPVRVQVRARSFLPYVTDALISTCSIPRRISLYTFSLMMP
jgi:hypothetical protein